MTRYGAVAAIALVIISGLYLVFSWTDQLVSLGGDSAAYMLMAHHYSPWQPHDSVAARFAAGSFYPPLYPILLGLAGVSSDVLAANVVTTLFLLLTFVALCIYARASDLGPWLSLLVTVLFAMAPGAYLQTVMAHSENLYLLLTVSALAFAAIYRKTDATGALMAMAACAALATLTRTAGIALIAALAAYALAHRDRRALLAFILAILPPLAWRWYHPNDTPYESHLGLQAGFGGLAAFLKLQWLNWLRVWPSNFGVSPPGVALLWLLSALGVANSLMRAVQFRIDGLYCCAYLLVCLAWPFPDEAQRLLFAIMPVLLVQAMLALQTLASALPGRAKGYAPLVPVVCAAGLIISMLPGTALVIGRYLQTPPELESYRHRPEWYAGDEEIEDFQARDQLVRSMRDVATRADMAPADCVYAAKPSLVAFHARRMSYALPSGSLDDTAFRRELASQPCGYFLMMGSTPAYPEFFYPFERLKDELEILALYSVPRDDGSQRHVAMLARWRRDRQPDS